MRNIDKMYALFGVVYEGSGICKNCSHFDGSCQIYGEKSGFADYYPACGLFGKEYVGPPPKILKASKNALLSGDIKVVHLGNRPCAE